MASLHEEPGSAGAMSHQQQQQGQRKYQSPPPPPPVDSMTPPPSSQSASRSAMIPAVARTPTPKSHLSSPPPTAANLKPSNSHEGIPAVFSPEQIADASGDELRSMLNDTQLAYREARATAAHKTLQYNLLTMETSEAINRMTVELSMSRNEVEVLQSARHGAAAATPVLHSRGLNALSPPDDQMIKTLRARLEALEIENETLQTHLDNAKTFILEREGIWHEENDRLRRRIRENREHFNLILRSNNLDRHELGSLSTHTTPRRQPAAKPRHDEPFAALLLADQVLSQEAATSPSTPQPRRNAGHTRGSHSLSSLPSTPMHARTAPVQRSYAQPDRTSPFRQRAVAPVPLPPVRRRREDRDSTISASDTDSDNDIPTSQASQEAASLLRSQSSFRAANQPATPVSATKSRDFYGSYSGQDYASAQGHGSDRLHQTKLFGQVGKSHASSPPKRKASAVHESPRAKKGRTEGVGLGIGGWAR